MSTDDIIDFGNAMSVVRQLHQGKILTLPDGNRIGMAEDYQIGFVLTKSDGMETIGGLSDLTIRQLNNLMKKHDVMVIPGG